MADKVKAWFETTTTVLVPEACEHLKETTENSAWMRPNQ